MIDTASALEALVERALQEEAVALDTEFVWERTYYPRLGVVQVGFSEDDVHLIDAAALNDLAPLGRVLADPDIVKILHDAQQDLIILRRATGAYPANIFDTRLAAGFVGLTATSSLGDLVQATVGVHLPKTESRTDWLRRPLSEQQRVYALDDVRYMPAVRNELLRRIRALGREAWVQEELAQYDEPSLYEERDPYEQHERVSGAGRLSTKQRAVLQELAAWREREARRQDRPRGHVLHDKVLGAIARRSPRTERDFFSIRGLAKSEIHQYGAALLEAVERGYSMPKDEHPERTSRPSIDDTLDARINFALAYLKGKSLAEGIDHALIANRADLTAFVDEASDTSPDAHILLRGWRRTFMGDDLLALLTGTQAVRLNPETGLPELF